MIRLLASAALLILMLGCGRESAATQQVRSAAAVDLDCDPSSVELVYDQPMLKRASGCGRTLTYMYRCSAQAGGGQNCRWIPVRDQHNELY